MRTELPTVAVIVLLLGAAACGDATGPAAADRPVATAPRSDAAAAPWTTPARVLFMHRSVGFALVRNGAPDMYQVLDELNAAHGTHVELWHHGCGSHPYWDRYYDGADARVEPNFGSAMSETYYGSPEHWRRIFCDPDPQYAAARDSIAEFRVIAFKSAYDNTVAYATDRAGQWRQAYRAMRDEGFLGDGTRRFVLLGMAPLREGLGGATQADADSARAFATWLAAEFAATRPNFHAFDLFDALAGPDNWLRDAYEKVDYPTDSHPNDLGCTVVGRELMEFMHAVARAGGDDERPAWADLRRQRPVAR